MKVFLDAKLAGHRRGRFLAAALQAQGLGDTLPEAGVLLMIGKDLQAAGAADRDALTAWCSGPGRTLLLLPPYSEGPVLASLDWTIGFRDAAAPAEGPHVAYLLAQETTYLLHGRDGDCDREAGHRWPDYSVNTRFSKAHSGSGVLAATCLPLWSITLLNEAAALNHWLRGLHRHAGLAVEHRGIDAIVAGSVPLAPEALGVMVCLCGWQTGDPDVIFNALEAQPVPMFQLDRERVAELLPQLRAGGYLDEQGLSAAGVAALRASPYWGFAVRLREELA
ncbi:hypothetical protein [uncultured Thiodictyon sp.]|uniref:hypothetical protein n=1 Tax=uncultured Thiodictyon sp. TaxID=1846217 RepID=UPI002600817B|nr:hypothetical protein [uncultured Thiodictyon sp.]